jgi:CheY-like chemotaxis protein
MAKKTILAVDDDKVVLAIIHDAFSLDFNLLMARDGHEAVELANDNKIDLILLDIMMPGFDGFSTLILLKENPNTKDIPVIMLTSVEKKEKVVEAFKDGAAGYILKPFREEALRSKIESVLTRYEIDKERMKSKAGSAKIETEADAEES